MKIVRKLITGLLVLSAFALLSPHAEAADVCNPNSIDTMYKGIYCGIRQDDSEDFDDDLIEILSTQFDMDEDIIKAILDNTICLTIKDYTEDEKAELPEAVQDACLPSGKSTGQITGGWNIFTDIKNTYEKERIIQQNSKSLEFKFKASEQYWDGQISTVTSDAPFDLIVDLNLIEMVLFGSKAQWMNDVFTFPPSEEEGEEEAAVPPAQPPAEEAVTPEEEVAEEAEEEGLAVTEEEGELPPDCVLPDNPEADLGDEPGSDYQNPLCGNGEVDVLMAEQCDDGNTESGDGCNQYCQTEASGSNDMCKDPEAVTFKKPEDIKKTGGAESQPKCPPGSVPKKGAAITGEEAGPPEEVPQSPEYPGPFLGGTLKQFPESKRPPCGPGESTLQITVAGKTHIAKDGDGNVICLPFPVCADPNDVRDLLFNDVRDLLFGENWQEDPIKKEIAEAIESWFCVDLIKENRPLSPYNKNEGCVDCHITAMVDAMEKALETNVTPLQNTMSAFGISSRWGPNFSFNLNTATKSKPKFKKTNTIEEAIKKVNEATEKSQNDNAPPKTAITTTRSPLAELAVTAKQAEDNRRAKMEDTYMLKISNGVISDQEVGGRIKPLLEQMRDSFATIQSKYESMISSTALDKKEQCTK
ncbi:MAG: hypothetical protein ABIG80_02205 [Patescibacteria group bacterium]